jgi:ABC-2 type transport system permease protein
MNSPIYSLWERQIKKYFRSKTRILGMLGQPILFLIVFNYGIGSMFQATTGGNYINFLAPGIIIMSVLFTSIFSGIEVITDRQFGFLKETLVSPVDRIRVFFGRTLGGATVATIQGIIVLGITILIGLQVTNWFMIPIAIGFMFLFSLLFTAFGTAIASKLDDMQAFQLIINFLIMPLLFLSSAIFPTTGFPEPLLTIAKYNPLSFGVDGIRGALSGVSQHALTTDAGILIVIVIILMIIGAKLFDSIQI